MSIKLQQAVRSCQGLQLLPPPPLAVVSVMTSCAVGSGLPPDFKAPLSLELSSVTAVAPSLSRLWHSAILSTQADSKHTATVWVEKSASCVADSCVCTAERSYAEHFARPRPRRQPKHQLGYYGHGTGCRDFAISHYYYISKKYVLELGVEVLILCRCKDQFLCA